MKNVDASCHCGADMVIKVDESMLRLKCPDCSHHKSVSLSRVEPTDPNDTQPCPVVDPPSVGMSEKELEAARARLLKETEFSKGSK